MILKPFFSSNFQKISVLVTTRNWLIVLIQDLVNSKHSTNCNTPHPTSFEKRVLISTAKNREVFHGSNIFWEFILIIIVILKNMSKASPRVCIKECACWGGGGGSRRERVLSKSTCYCTKTHNLIITLFRDVS